MKTLWKKDVDSPSAEEPVEEPRTRGPRSGGWMVWALSLPSSCSLLVGDETRVVRVIRDRWS